MQTELNNLLWLAKRKIIVDSGLNLVCTFLENHPEYLISSNDVIQINEILRQISQNAIKYGKTAIINFIEKITKQLLNYFLKSDNESQRYEIITINLISKEEIFHTISISLITQLFIYPEKYKLFLHNVVDHDFCNLLMELNGKECKSIQQLFKTIAADDVDFCLNFVEKSLNDKKKLKLIEILIKSLQSEFIEKFLESLNDPKYSMVFVYILNELPEQHRKTAMNFIIENIDQIDLNAFAKKLSKNSISTKLFVKQENMPCELVLNVLLKITNNFDCFDLFPFENLLKTEIENSEPVLLLFYYINQKQRKKITLDLANEFLEKFENDDNLYRLFSLLISENLFLYMNEKNESFSDFLEKLLNCLRSSCTLTSINLYTTIIKMIEGEKLSKYIDQLFEALLNADQNSIEFISNCLLSIFTKNQKNFIYSIEFVHKYYKTVFPDETISNYDTFSKFIYFLDKYFKLSESIYPISDFDFTPHNKSLIENKEKVLIGKQNHEFLLSKADTVQSLLIRISFAFNFDLPQDMSNLNDFSDVEKYFKSIDLSEQSSVVPPPVFFSNETQLSYILLVNITNPEIDELTISKIANILDYMPEDTNFLPLINKGIISVFTSNVYVKYVILLDHTQLGQNFVKCLVEYFCHCNDNSLKQDILTHMRKHLKIIASLNNIDFSKLYNSFFQMLKSPDVLKISYRDFLQYIIENTKSQLVKFFETKKKITMVNPPEFLWPVLMKLVNLVGLDKEYIIKLNRNNEFGVFVAKDIIKQVSLTGKDIDVAFKLLEVHYFINNSGFFTSLCQNLTSNNSAITIKNMNILLLAAAHVQNEVIISNIFRVFTHFLKIDKFKKIFHSIFRNFLRETDSLDFSFDPKNYVKNELAIKFKESSNNSPLNSILQVFQNLSDNSKNLSKFCRSFADPLIERAWPDFVYKEMNPIKIIKRLDIVNLIQFEDQFPDTTKPIFIRENFHFLYDLQSSIVKYNRTFEFKGLVAQIDCEYDSKKYVAIVKKNGKLIQIIDDSIEIIQSIPKETKKFKINFAVYCEQKEIEQIENYQFRFFNKEKERFEYEKILLAYSNEFKKIILKMSKNDILLSYYVKFVIKMKDINVINEFSSNLHSLEFHENFYRYFIFLIPSILKDLININDNDVLYNFKNTILQDFLFKMPDKNVIEICRTYLYISLNCIKNNPSKISLIFSIFRDFARTRKKVFKNESDVTDILNLLDMICLECLKPDADDKYYSILNMHSIFDSINFFIRIFNSINEKKESDQEDIHSILSCLDKLEENHFKIIKNKENAGSYIFLIQKVFRKDEEYLDNFYKKLFLSESQSKDDDLIKDEYFLISLIELTEKNAEKLLDVYFNQFKIHDANYLFKKIEQFIKQTPSFLVKFLKYLPIISHYLDEYSIEFIPYLSRILYDSVDLGKTKLLQSLLVDYEKKVKSNSISIIDFKTLIIILKILNDQSYIQLISKFMLKDNRKNDDLFCLFFGELLLSCRLELLKPMFIYDVILYRMNDLRVDFVIFFLKKFNNDLPKNFFIHQKMKELYLYCIVHNQINSLFVDDYAITVYNFLYDIQNQASAKLSMSNPPSDRFKTIANLIKTKTSSKFAQIKVSNQHPFNFIEHTQRSLTEITFSETISSLFNFLTEQEDIDFDTNIIDSLIDNILSNNELDSLDLKINNQNKLIEIIKTKKLSDDFKSHLLDLMIFSQSRDEKAFSQMESAICNLKTGIFELDDKIFFFLTLKALYGNESSLLPFLMDNVDPFVNSILKMVTQPVLLKKEKQPELMKLIESEIDQSNFVDYTFDSVKNVILRNILSQ